MTDPTLKEIIDQLFNLKWDEDRSEEAEEKLQDMFDNAIERYGWDQVFDTIDHYMRTSCPTSEDIVNFANLFWNYTCENPRKIPDPYRFLGYLYYRIDSKPWDYDCAEVYEGLVYNLLSGKDDYTHNPYTNIDYIPEKDPCLVAEIEKLRKADA